MSAEKALEFLSDVHERMLSLATEAESTPQELAAVMQMTQEPAVPVGESVQHDFIVCLEDGSRHQMMKRYLMRKFGLTPQAYRAKWGLPKDYPMTAPGYSERKRAEAKAVGLGTLENKSKGEERRKRQLANA